MSDTSTDGTDLSTQDYRRILVGLSLYKNEVEEEGNDELAGELADLGMRLARNIEADTNRPEEY